MQGRYIRRTTAISELINMRFSLATKKFRFSTHQLTCMVGATTVTPVPDFSAVRLVSDADANEYVIAFTKH